MVFRLQSSGIWCHVNLVKEQKLWSNLLPQSSGCYTEERVACSSMLPPIYHTNKVSHTRRSQSQLTVMFLSFKPFQNSYCRLQKGYISTTERVHPVFQLQNFEFYVRNTDFLMANVKFFNENTCYKWHTCPNLCKFKLHKFKICAIKKKIQIRK